MTKHSFNVPFIFILSFSCLYAGAQNTVDTLAFKKMGKVEVDTSFANDDTKWIPLYLQKNINPGVPVANGAPIGKYTVAAQFVIAKDGIVSDVRALTNHGYGMEAEVVKLLTKMPKWMPAGQNEKGVKPYGKQFVTFFVEDKRITITSASPYTLYTNTDNKLSVRVYNVKPKNIIIRLSGGTMAKTDDGDYIIKVDEPGRDVWMTIKAKRKRKALGVVNFDVQQGPH